MSCHVMSCPEMWCTLGRQGPLSVLAKYLSHNRALPFGPARCPVSLVPRRISGYTLMLLRCAGMVSLLPTIDGRLFHIKGGNRLLAERLINATAANLLLGTRVTAVHKGARLGFQVHSRHVDALTEVRTGFQDTPCSTRLDSQSVTRYKARVGSERVALYGCESSEWP